MTYFTSLAIVLKSAVYFVLTCAHGMSYILQWFHMSPMPYRSGWRESLKYQWPAIRKDQRSVSLRYVDHMYESEEYILEGIVRGECD